MDFDPTFFSDVRNLLIKGDKHAVCVTVKPESGEMSKQVRFKDNVSQAVFNTTKELESLHPELFENLPLPQDDILPAENELTDDQMVQFLEQWEKEMKVAFDFYNK